VAMLPLEGILFVPSLVVTPFVLAALFFWRRRSPHYPRILQSAGIICFLLCGLFLVQVLNTPLYSKRDHRPDNPGGFTTGITSVIGVFLLESCVVIPAFPVLLGLTCLSPRGWRARTRILLIVFCVLYVGILAWLIAWKNATFVADYQRAKQQERRQDDQFQHVRRP